MDIREIKDEDDKLYIGEYILNSLNDWFELEEARESYIRDLKDQFVLACMDQDLPLGFLSLKKTGDRTCEIAVMGVLQSHHRQGIGRKLVEVCKLKAREKGYLFLQVKTLKFGVDKIYDRTNLFYRSMGFWEFELMENLWGKDNPCQLYILGL